MFIQGWFQKDLETEFSYVGQISQTLVQMAGGQVVVNRLKRKKTLLLDPFVFFSSPVNMLNFQKKANRWNCPEIYCKMQHYGSGI